MKILRKELFAALMMTAVLAVIVCGVYPLVVFVSAQALFPSRANGSVIYHNGIPIGSALLGQRFGSPEYFHPRPSAAGAGYDASSSGGSNLGPTSAVLLERVRNNAAQYRMENGLSENTPVPADAATASGSGLDPHISMENALMQAPRVAKARNWSERAVEGEIQRHTAGRTLGILGKPRVNVLQLNIALDNSGAAEK